MPKIVTHTIIRNEQRFVWYALMSMLDYVDEMLVWDTGSTDRTPEIVESIDSPKIKFRRLGKVTADEFTTVSQQMLEKTVGDWVINLDGDEIWPWSAVRQMTDLIRRQGNSLDFLVHKYFNLIGDIFHYQPESAGKYRIGPFSGHVTIRAVNRSRISGLHYDRPHMQRGLFDGNGVLIQERTPFLGQLLPGRYLHATHLRRSENAARDLSVIKRAVKYKFELGIPFSDDFIFPEVFFLPRPSLVASPWQRRSVIYLMNASWQTPLKLFKRRLSA